MHDLPRVSFLLMMNVLLVAMLVVVLGGCVSTPAQNRYRHGDFIMNIGSAAPVINEPFANGAPPTNVAASSAPTRG
jgi:hypothetical protein